MPHYDTPHSKAIASETITAPIYVGTDATGADHFWSITDRAIAVVEPDDTAERFDLGETADPLGTWRRNVSTNRGWADCRIEADQLGAGVLGGR